MELQRDVPQYMAIPWLMTWVMARTVSERERRETVWDSWGSGPVWGESADAGGVPGGGSRLRSRLASSVLPGSRSWGWVLEREDSQRKENRPEIPKTSSLTR